MNHRQLNLHNIIKQQQAKISQLKQQLGLVTQLSQSHLIDTEKRTLDAVKQKDQIIGYLKNQLDTERTKCREAIQALIMHQNVQTRNLQLQQRDKCIEQQCNRLTSRNTQLQKKLQQQTESYEKKITLLQRQNKRISSQSSNSANQSKLIESEIDKLTKFYKSSMFQIPKRKQTLLWVDNLIKYMQVWQKSSEKKYQELYTCVKDKLNETRVQCIKTVNETVLIQQKLLIEGQKLFSQLKKLFQQKHFYQQQISTNIDQLQKQTKKQKQSIQKSQLQFLRASLTNQQLNYKQQKIKLQSRIKELQQQKKTLVLGFQQIKTFLENKQNNYKQQIMILKQTINDLLQGGQMRQKQFQEQMRILSAQIQTISSRYYQNIEYPVLKMNQKVQRQLIKVKDQLMKLSEQHVFKQQLLKLSQRLKKFTTTVEQEKEFVAIELCMKKGNQLLISIRQLLTQMGEKKSQRQSLSRIRTSSVYSTSGQKRQIITTKREDMSSIKKSSQERQSIRGSQKNMSNIRQSQRNTINDKIIKQSHQQQNRNKKYININKTSSNRKSNQRQSSSNQRKMSSNQRNLQSESKYTPANQLSFQQSQPLLFPMQSVSGMQTINPRTEQFELQQISELQQVVSEIQLRQKENKYIYEINLLKRHNLKLNEHINLLERKFKNIASNKFIDEKVMSGYFKTQRRIIQLETQNQKYKDINTEYERLFNQEIQKVYKKITQLEKQMRKTGKEQASILQALAQLNQRHQLITQILTSRNEKIRQLQQSTHIINSLLIKPQQTFQSLIKQFTTQLSSLTVLNNQQTQRTFGGGQFSSIAYSNASHRSRLSINESVIKDYQQILNKRTQTNANMGRYISELIKTLRETFPVRENKKRYQDSSLNMNGQKQNNMNKSSLGLNNKSNNTKLSAIQKKLKQLTTQQQKYKQQLLIKIQKLQQTILSLDLKYQKNSKLIQNKDKKIQQLLLNYTKQTVQQIKFVLQREKREQLGLNTQALKDTASKLKESIRENQGLKREMDVLYLIGRGGNANSRQVDTTTGDNFYQ